MSKIKSIIAFSGLILNSCTFNISMVHTQGTASDVIDETQSTTPTIKTEISIPAI